MFERVRTMVSGVRGRVAGFVGLCVMGLMGLFAGEASAATTIPAMPVDFADIASEGVTVLGTVIAGVVGIFVVVALVNMGIKWIRRAFTS